MRLAPSMEPGWRINSGACLRPDRRYRRCSGNAVRAPPRHIHLEGLWSVTGPLLGRSLSVTAASPSMNAALGTWSVSGRVRSGLPNAG